MRKRKGVKLKRKLLGGELFNCLTVMEKEGMTSHFNRYTDENESSMT